MQKLAIAALTLTLAATACADLGPPRTASGAAAGAAPGPVAVAPNPAPNAVAAGASQVAPQPPTAATVAGGLVVVGEGSAKVDPDVAYVTTGVQTRARTAREAQDQNTRQIADVLKAIKALGVVEADLHTRGVSLQPDYGRTPGQIDGYSATNSVTITVQDVSKVGQVLDTAVAAGANQAGGVQFGLKSDAQPRARALDEAVKSARARADVIAAAAGVRIVGIASLTDLSSGAQPPLFRALPAAAAGLAEAAQSAGPVPVQPGQLNVSARVQVVYSVQ